MSTLSLPLKELKLATTRYLLIKELCSEDVALYILFLELQHRRERAYVFSFSLRLCGIDKRVEALEILNTMEDRFVNPVTIAMTADNINEKDLMRYKEMKRAGDLFNKRKEEDLSIIEIYFKAMARTFTIRATPIDHSEMIRMFELCVARDFLPAYSALVDCFYIDIRVLTKYKDRLYEVMEKGVSLGCFTCLDRLANALYNDNIAFPVGIKDPVAIMCIRAARHGVDLAVRRCRAHGWDY